MDRVFIEEGLHMTKKEALKILGGELDIIIGHNGQLIHVSRDDMGDIFACAVEDLDGTPCGTEHFFEV